jgi:NitT/TauT family transport system substrate-binding protein
MPDDKARAMNRRTFLFESTLVGAGLFRIGEAPVAAEAPLETTRIRLVHDPGICVTPQYLAEDLLRADGFTQVDYIEAPDGSGAKLIAAGRADMMMELTGVFVTRIDAGDPLVVLGGVHVGCLEIFGGPRVRAIRDLKGKRVATLGEGGPDHVFLSSVIAYVGLDPRRDIRWESPTAEEWIRLLAEDRVDTFVGFPPCPRSSGPGRSGRSCSRPRRTGPGLSISAAWWAPIETLSGGIPWRRSESCAPS